MLKKPAIPGRFSLLFSFVVWFLTVSLLIRIIFFIWQYDEVSFNALTLLGILFTGLFFDIGTVSFIILPAVLYYAVFPNKWIGSWADKILVWFFTSLTLFILVFTFFAELTFWDEFKTRFNFIAVDYLIYTHGVLANIEQSYPIPLLVSGVALITVLVLFVFHKRKAFRNTFTHRATLKQRITALGICAVASLFFATFITNIQAEWSGNRYNSEISKSGIYSFFAAFSNNQMEYREFYISMENEKAFGIIRNKLKIGNSSFNNQDNKDGFGSSTSLFFNNKL